MCEAKKMLRKELCDLTNEHDIVKCEDEKCVICCRVKEIGQILVGNMLRFKLTNRDGRVKEFTSLEQVRKFLHIGVAKIKEAITTGKEIKCWVIEKTDW